MLDEAITAWTSHHIDRRVLATLERADVPAGRIYSVADIVDDPHYQARDMLLEADLPGGASVKMPGIVPKLSDTPGEVHWQARRSVNTRRRCWLRSASMSNDIERLRAEGAVQ